MTGWCVDRLRWRGVGGLALAVGVAAAVAPDHAGRAFGIPSGQLVGPGVLGFRLFGVRTGVVAAAVLAGSVDARRAVVLVQLLDQLVFMHALRSGDISRRTAVLCAGTAAVLIALAPGRSAGPHR